MGNTINVFSAQGVVASDYQLINKFSSLRWGELFQMKNTKTGQLVFMQEKHSSTLEGHQRNIKNCNFRLSLSHDNLANLHGFSHNDSVDSLTNTYKVCIFFESVSDSLLDIMKMRKASAQNKQRKNDSRSCYFDESELLRYLNQLIDVLSYLQHHGINLGDITPDVCFVSEHGMIKVLDKRLIYGETSAFDLARQGQANIFLTPLEMEALGNGSSKINQDRYKADVFRVGLTLLECATFQRSAAVYDWENYKIDIQALSARIIEIKNRYSPAFYETLREMLRFDETKRPDFVSLNQVRQEEAAKRLTMSLSQGHGNEENSRKSLGTTIGPKLATAYSPVKTLQPGSGGKRIFGTPNNSNTRGRQKDKKARQDDDDDIMDEFESDNHINQIPYTEALSSPRVSMQTPTKHTQQASNRNIAQSTREMGSKKITNTPPMKSEPKSFMDMLPDNGPLYDPNLPTPAKLIQVMQYDANLRDSAMMRNNEKEMSKKAGRFNSPGEQERVIPFNDNKRPSAPVVNSPKDLRNVDFKHLSNFPQLGKYTYPFRGSQDMSNEGRPSYENFPQERYSAVSSSSFQTPKRARISGNTNLQPPEMMQQQQQEFSSISRRSPNHQSVSHTFFNNPENSSFLFKEEDSKMIGPLEEESQLELLAERYERLQMANRDTSPNQIRKSAGGFNTSEMSPAAYKGVIPGRLTQERPVNSMLPQARFVQEKEELTGSFRNSPSLSNILAQENIRNSEQVGGRNGYLNSFQSFGPNEGEQMLEDLNPRSETGFLTDGLKKEDPRNSRVVKFKGDVEEKKDAKIDDRFDQAMQRSRRSEGFLKEMSKSLSKSPNKGS